MDSDENNGKQNTNLLQIIVPAYNEEDHLPALLSSLEACGLSCSDVIVVNCASTDETSHVANSYGAKVIQLNSKVTPSGARNAGARESTAEFIVFLDADIVVTQTWADTVIEIAKQQEDYLNGDTYGLSTNPSYLERVWFSALPQKSYINGGNIVIKRRVFEAIGGFDEGLETGEDVEFSQRTKASGYQIKFNSGLRVHHEGNPKTIKAFIARERWHGKGDLTTLNHFMKSKVALTSALFGLFHIMLLLSLVLKPVVAPVFLLSISFLCLAIAIVKFGIKTRSLFSLTMMVYFYLTGRTLSIFSQIRFQSS
jgi:glycosyltransferase involved in cell wall biosynthesis